MEALEFRILGQMEVLRGGERLALGGHRQLAVLAVLVIDAGRVVSSDRLIDALWPEEPPSGARATVQAYVSKLRRALEPDRHPAAPESALQTHGPGYLLRIDAEAIDARRFERLAGEGRATLTAGDAEAAAELLAQALALWRGPALADFAFDPFAATEITRLDELRLTVTEDQVEAALALGRHRAVVGDLEQLVAAYPFRERLRAQLMLAFYRSGRQAEALRAYQAGRRMLAEELGIDPSPALKDLEGAILRQDPSLDWAASERPHRLSSLAPDRLATVVPPPDTEVGGRPSETVTFLLTDMERSTLLWAEHAGAAAVVARHHDLVAQVVEGHGGILPGQSEGDSVLAVFSRASQAVAVALDIQRALTAEPWPDGITVRVRMGLHTGEAVIRQGNYYGLAVNRAARLRALAHGGQILCSQATAEVVADHLPPAAGLRDMGVHRLSDLNRPEHVFQVCHPDVRSDFPPLPSPESPPHNLPAALTSFVGRRQELAEVKKALEGARLVTLVGAGGVGKTRLALEVAGEVVASYPDGVWLADLAPLSQASLVPQAVAGALHLREDAGHALVDTLAEYFRPRRVLLVLDNCEHLVAATAALVEALLRAAPALHVLATSREPLGVTGEVAWRVPSLATPHPTAVLSLETLSEYESVRLFLDRAEAASPGLAVRLEDAPTLSQICARLDGIPLAIELAAARVGVLSLEQIATRLDDRFALLASGPRTGLPRHQTLKAAVDWSHDLLGTAEQVLLRRLSVFASDFSLEAAEAVGPGPGVDRDRILDLLASLVAKSLVVRDFGAGQARYRLLETIRQYAQRKLAVSGDELEAALRHRDFYLAVAEAATPEAFGARGGLLLERLETEYDNFRAALERILAGGDDAEVGLRLADALHPLWLSRGRYREGRRWMEQLLARPGPPTSTRAAVARKAAALALDMRDHQGASALADDALDLARACGDRLEFGRSEMLAGVLATDRGDFGRAGSLLGEAVAMAQEEGDQDFLAEALLWSGWLAHYQSRYDAARALAQDCREAGSGNWFQDARAAHLLGWVEQEEGDLAEAQRHHQRSLDLATSRGDPGTQATALEGLALVAEAEGRSAEARQNFEEALGLSRDPEHGWPALISLVALGQLAAAEGEDPDRVLLQEGLRNARQTGDVFLLAWSLERVGRTALHFGDATGAREALGEALTTGHRAGMPWILAASLEGLASVDATAGQVERAVRLLGAAEALRQAIGAPLAPSAAAAHERATAAARVDLGKTAFAAAWAEGASASLDEVVALALGPSEGAGTSPPPARRRRRSG